MGEKWIWNWMEQRMRWYKIKWIRFMIICIYNLLKKERHWVFSAQRSVRTCTYLDLNNLMPTALAGCNRRTYKRFGNYEDIPWIILNALWVSNRCYVSIKCVKIELWIDFCWPFPNQVSICSRIRSHDCWVVQAM